MIAMEIPRSYASFTSSRAVMRDFLGLAHDNVRELRS